MKNTSTSADVHRAATLEAAIETVGSAMRNRLMNGWYVRSVSHALDPEGAERKWSVIVVYGEIDYDDDRRGGLSISAMA
jgi:hypothetical protein